MTHRLRIEYDRPGIPSPPRATVRRTIYPRWWPWQNPHRLAEQLGREGETVLGIEPARREGGQG